MEITRTFAEFIKRTTFNDIPAAAASTAKYLILDAVGVALGGSIIPGGRIAIRYARELNARPACTVIGGGFKTTAADAAWCNGVLAHSLEYEDAWPEAMHPSSMLFPASLAIAEEFGRSGKDLLGAYIVGLEVFAKIATSAPNITHTRGWHGSSVYGAVGAAAAASKLLDLEVDAICYALAIAASGASGLIRQRGTMAKWYNQGNAARQGVTAALLAKAGFTGDRNILEGAEGFMDVFHADGGFDLTRTAPALGKPFHLVSPGVSVRKYPCAYVYQGVIDTVVDLLQKLGVSYDDVQELVVPVTPQQRERYDHPVPRSAIGAQFNLRYPLAVALRHGKLSRHDFTDEKVGSSDIKEAVSKVTITSLSPAQIPEGTDPARYQPGVILRLKDGREVTHRLPNTRGRYDDSTPKSVFVLPKFRENAADCLSPAETDRCIALVERLEQLDELSAFTDIIGNARSVISQ